MFEDTFQTDLNQIFEELEDQLPEVPILGPSEPQIPSPPRAPASDAQAIEQPPAPGKDVKGEGKAKALPTPCRAATDHPKSGGTPSTLKKSRASTTQEAKQAWGRNIV